MDGDEVMVKNSLFARELIELYELIRTVLRAEPEVEINMATAYCLPVHGQKYFYLNINALEPIVADKEDSVHLDNFDQPAEDFGDFQEGFGDDGPDDFAPPFE